MASPTSQRRKAVREELSQLPSSTSTNLLTLILSNSFTSDKKGEGGSPCNVTWIWILSLLVPSWTLAYGLLPISFFFFFFPSLFFLLASSHWHLNIFKHLSFLFYRKTFSEIIYFCTLFLHSFSLYSNLCNLAFVPLFHENALMSHSWPQSVNLIHMIFSPTSLSVIFVGSSYSN